VLKVVVELHGYLGNFTAAAESLLEASAVFKLEELLDAGVALPDALFPS
jgi:hypothetical protein